MIQSRLRSSDDKAAADQLAARSEGSASRIALGRGEGGSAEKARDRSEDDVCCVASLASPMLRLSIATDWLRGGVRHLLKRCL